ncbi:MAG: DUF499 domain-containing protein [Pirellulaceae bacterium]
MEPWHKIVEPRKEVRQGRSFNPDEFAIALERVVTGEAPEDYQDPEKFFSRTCWTRALRENTGSVLRRLAGQTNNTAPVQTLVTQMGGGKTHMLAALWHLSSSGPEASRFQGVPELLREAGLDEAPTAKVAVFVGNSWDPQPGRETPWIDVARQIAGDDGVTALGPAAKESAPGTETIDRLIALARRPVVLLFDELLNFFTRYDKSFGDQMHAFLHNIVRCFVGSAHRAAVFSLPRSQVEMNDRDLYWQDRILKVVGAVAKPLLVNDESEISEVIRRRLFEELGQEKYRKATAKTYADWCFERRAQLPPEWMAVDTSTTEKKARDYLQGRFEACFPFHPATLSVFQRKWQALPQFQQTRGVLAMLAQWISWAYKDNFLHARREPLITLGSAPLHIPEFRSEVLKQLGENRLATAIETDIAGDRSHSKVLDADAKGPLKEIHRRVGTAILFESSGGQRDKVAHLPELRFALGEPEIETTSVDNAAMAMERKGFFLQKVGSDGFKVYHKAKIDKAVHDRRASLDDETDIKPIMRQLADEEFKRGATLPLVRYPEDDPIQDSPRLTLVLVDPVLEWNGGDLRDRIAECTKNRGKSSRLYPGSLVWCVRKPGKDLREKVEMLQAWRRVQRDVRDGVLGPDFEKADHQEIAKKVSDAEVAARDEIWAGYRWAILADGQSADGLKAIDLGAGHSSGSESLCGRVIAAMKAEALLNESVGAGYIDRNWPPTFKESGAWPLSSLRQSFLNGALTRLVDPDRVLQQKIVEFVRNGDFGLASGPVSGGGYERVYFEEAISPEDVAFEAGVLLLKKQKAATLKRAAGEPAPAGSTIVEPAGSHPTGGTGGPPVVTPLEPPTTPSLTRLRISGAVPAEQWNRMGTKILPKLRAGKDLRIDVSFSIELDTKSVADMRADLRQVLEDLGLTGTLRIDTSGGA